LIIQYSGALFLKGNLLFFKPVEGVKYGERVIITSPSRELTGRVAVLSEDYILIEILGDSSGLDLASIKGRFTGELFSVPVAESMLGRIMDGFARPVDNLGDILPEKHISISGGAYNPAKREYPSNVVKTGISSIDGLNTMVRGQKLPVFAVSGVPTDRFVAQLVRQIDTGGSKKAVVFSAVGIKYETADYLIEDITSGGNFPRTAVFLSLADEPPANHLIAVRTALSFSEFLAFEKGYHVVVVLYDMTNYCDALREVSSKKGEIPGRKGYPGYMYSDLASIYERAGIVKGAPGSITQMPVLTMPDDDITHPVPDLTGYITEGQIVLDRSLHHKGVYPPVNVLPSLSRLMSKAVDGLHKRWANQLYSAYARAKRVEMLASIVGEGEISELERKYLEFGRRFEKEFINQGEYENRSMEETMEIGWRLLKILPPQELVRLKKEDIQRFVQNDRGQ